MKEVEKKTSPVKEEKDQENDGELEVSEEKLAAGMKISVFFSPSLCVLVCVVGLSSPSVNTNKVSSMAASL